jgi:hypothetical protein
MTERKQAPEATDAPQKAPAVGSQVDLVLGPLPEELEAAVRNFAVSCAFGGDAEQRVSGASRIRAAVRAYAAAQVAEERERWQREPVAAQCRFPGVAWSQCDVAHARMVIANPSEWPTYQVRLLCEWVGPNGLVT